MFGVIIITLQENKQTKQTNKQTKTTTKKNKNKKTTACQNFAKYGGTLICCEEGVCCLSPFHNIYIVYFTICNIIFEMQFVMVLTTCHMSNFSDNK